jgi:hypothetical protein
MLFYCSVHNSSNVVELVASLKAVSRQQQDQTVRTTVTYVTEYCSVEHKGGILPHYIKQACYLLHTYVPKVYINL